MDYTKVEEDIRAHVRDLVFRKKPVKYSEIASLFVNDPTYGLSPRQHRALRRRVAKIHASLFASNHDGTKTVTEDEDTATYEYKGTRSIRNFEEAVIHCGVDLNVWEIEKKVFNSWDVTMKGKDGKPIASTNYQYKLWFRRKKTQNDFKNLIDSYLSTRDRVARLVEKSEGKSKTAVHALADFHFGAYVDGLRKTPDFNFSILIDYLSDIAEEIRSQNNQHNHIFLLGDFIESFTGMNHKNSWKGLHKGAHGVNAVILAYEILLDFLRKVPNLETIDIVKGNHDRTSADKEEDMEGGAAKLLAYMLKRDFDHVNFDSMVITRLIDGIHYLGAHGDLGVSKSSVGDFMFKYGIQRYYNLGLQGHLHSVRKKTTFQTVDGVIDDQVNYQMRNISPLFTGNSWSEGEGWTSSAGFTSIRSNGKGKPIITDHLL